MILRRTIIALLICLFILNTMAIKLKTDISPLKALILTILSRKENKDKILTVPDDIYDKKQTIQQNFNNFQSFSSATFWMNNESLLNSLNRDIILNFTPRKSDQTDEEYSNQRIEEYNKRVEVLIELAYNYCVDYNSFVEKIKLPSILNEKHIKVTSCETLASNILFSKSQDGKIITTEHEKILALKMFPEEMKDLTRTTYKMNHKFISLINLIDILRIQPSIERIFLKSKNSNKNINNNDLKKASLLVGFIANRNTPSEYDATMCSAMIIPDQSTAGNIRAVTARHCFEDESMQEIVFRLANPKDKNQNVDVSIVKGFETTRENNKLELKEFDQKDFEERTKTGRLTDAIFYSDYAEIVISRNVIDFINPKALNSDKTRIIKLNGKSTKSNSNYFIFGRVQMGIDNARALLVPSIQTDKSYLEKQKQIEMKQKNLRLKYEEYEQLSNEILHNLNDKSKLKTNIKQLNQVKTELKALSKKTDFPKTIIPKDLQDKSAIEKFTQELQSDKASIESEYVRQEPRLTRNNKAKAFLDDNDRDLAENKHEQMIIEDNTQKIDKLNKFSKNPISVRKIQELQKEIDAIKVQAVIRIHAHLIGGISGSPAFDCDIIDNQVNCNLIGSLHGIQKHAEFGHVGLINIAPTK